MLMVQKYGIIVVGREIVDWTVHAFATLDSQAPLAWMILAPIIAMWRIKRGLVRRGAAFAMLDGKG